MKAVKRKSLEQRIAARTERRKDNVFLRRDFRDLGGYDQVGRGLRSLVAEGQLVKIGYGLYARGATSPLSSKTIPAKPPARARRRGIGAHRRGNRAIALRSGP